MLTSAPFEQVYLARGSTGMRKSIDGLAAIATECFDLDPFSPCLFVFLIS
ncbi:IS66 family insertion sequence element accessory protein TnpB [Virgibacillus proomii]|nr:IS66 family insertion sequence element accessory protein TnpB [Virgibacillus proomii]